MSAPPHFNADNDPDAPYARRAPPIHGKPDQLDDDAGLAENRQEALIDEGLEESFPASDPISVKRVT